MHRFSWSAHDLQGKVQQGELSASSASEARAQLRQLGWMGIELRRQNSSGIGNRHRVRTQDITVLTRQLATMLGTDVPLLSALAVMASTSTHQGMRDLLKHLHRDILGGLSLAQALARHPKNFDGLYRHVVAAGEASGSLGLLLERLANQRERQQALAAQLRAALLYPAAVVTVAALVVVVILLWVVPTFESVYAGFGADLPALTQWLLAFSRGLAQHFVTVLLCLLCIAWGLPQLRHQPWATAAWDRWTLGWPVFGRLQKLAATTRWSRTLSTLLDAGIELNRALVSVSGASGHAVFESASLDMAQQVQQGSALAPAMQSTRLFTPVVLQLSAIGEASGTLSTMLAKSAFIGEQALEAELQGLSSLIEPIIIVILGLLIGTIVLALYWPIFELGQVI